MIAKDYVGLYNVDYRIINDIPTLLLFIRKENGVKEILYKTDFKPYCYVNNILLHNENFTLPAYAKLDGQGLIDINGNPTRKISFTHPKHQLFFKKYVKEIQGNIDNTYELDLPFDTRFMIDCVDKIIPTKYKIVTFDIETTIDYGFPKNDNPIESITCITAHDNIEDRYYTFVWRDDLEKEKKVDGNKVIYYFNNEIDMLNEFVAYIQKTDCDILTAWNVGFDIGYTYARLEKLGINVQLLSTLPDKLQPIMWKEQNFNSKVTRMTKGEITIVGTLLADSLKMYKQLHFGELESFSLNSVANAELGDQKLPVHNMSKVWREDLDDLIKYNIKDVELVVRINEKCKLMNLFEQIRCFAGVRNITDCFYMSRIHDIKILKKYRGKVAFPTKPDFVERKGNGELQGAYVFSNPGLYDNVVFFDYSGLYPNIIKTFNLSKEKISDDGTLVNDEIGVRVNQDSQGIMPSAIDDLLQLKADLKRQMDGVGSQDIRDKMFAVKVVINSIWGVFASSGFRMNNMDLANTVTLNARKLICKARDIVFDATGYTHVMSDTDSVGFVIPKEIDPIIEGRRLQKLINDGIEKYVIKDMGLPKNYIFIEYEKFAKKAFIQTKKRYVLRITWEDKECDKIKACGMQMRRSDSAPMSKVFQKKMFEMLLHDHEFNELNDCVATTIDEMFSGKIKFEDVAIPSKLSKAIEEYTITRTDKNGITTTKPGNRPVIRGVKWSNENLGLNLREGNKFKLVYVNCDDTDVVCVEDEAQFNRAGLKIDWPKMIIKNVYQKALPIYDVLGKMDDLNDIFDRAKRQLNGQTTLF